MSSSFQSDCAHDADYALLISSRRCVLFIFDGAVLINLMDIPNFREGFLEPQQIFIININD